MSVAADELKVPGVSMTFDHGDAITQYFPTPIC